jgi:protoporphyrin/coproporphyrin ferrochelatase
VAGARGKVGVLLVNLGTPRSPATGDVRRYLREFLSDPRVLDMNPLARFLLVNAVIAPFRAPRSAAQYASIWHANGPGSPLLANGLALRESLARELGAGFEVELGMRYGEPSLAGALDRLAAAGVSRIVALPLFPQWAESSLGSAAARLRELAARRPSLPPLDVRGEFFAAPGFVAAAAEIARPRLHAFRPAHVLFSYHGLPERHVRAADPTGRHCLVSESCCDSVGNANPHCYRAQCVATTRALVAALGLAEGAWSFAFQSRLGRDPWIRPYTDVRIPELARSGVKRLAVLCPSFAADCLETLEEIGVRAREQWRESGGEALELVPCVNAHPTFVRFLAEQAR